MKKFLLILLLLNTSLPIVATPWYKKFLATFFAVAMATQSAQAAHFSFISHPVIAPTSNGIAFGTATAPFAKVPYEILRRLDTETVIHCTDFRCCLLKKIDRKLEVKVYCVQPEKQNKTRQQLLHALYEKIATINP